MQARGLYKTRDRALIIKDLGSIVAYINKIFGHRGLLKIIRQGGTVEAKCMYGKQITVESHCLDGDRFLPTVGKKLFKTSLQIK
jgi:hypothetical protein